MQPRLRKILTCRALAHVVAPLAGEGTEMRIMDIALHSNPEKLRVRLLREVSEMEDQSSEIILGYGLCGRALEGVVSRKSTLVMPRVDDCVCALLGSRERRKKLLREDAGCYFLEQHWLDTELNVFVDLLKGLDKVPFEKRNRVVKMMLKNYRTLALLDAGDLSHDAESRCRDYAAQYEMNLIRIETDYGLLTRLINGPWREEEFLVLPPDTPVPLF
jgi:hypothetical protein